MPKVTAEHFRKLGFQSFQAGEPQPTKGTTWQSRARLEGWLDAASAACTPPLPADHFPPEHVNYPCVQPAPLVATPQPGWCDGCTPDECPGCGNVMTAMVEQESCRSTQPVRGQFIMTTGDANALSKAVGDRRFTVLPNDDRTDNIFESFGGRVPSRREFAQGPDERPKAYLRRSRIGWDVVAMPPEQMRALLVGGIKRKTHARNIAARMGYQIVDEPK